MILDGAYPTGWNTDVIHGASRKALYDKLVLLPSFSDINKPDIVSGDLIYLNDFVRDNENALGWEVDNTSVIGIINFKFRIPYNSQSWKIKISFSNSVTSKTIQGLLYAGIYRVGGSFAYNTFAGIDFDLISATYLKRADRVSGVFTAEKDDILYVYWKKNNDDGMGMFIFIDCVLYV